MTSETVGVVVRLSAFVHEEDGAWVAGCRSLDVFSQGDSPEEARANLREAVELWLECCLEQETLAEALRELGWFRVPPGAKPLPGGDLLEELNVPREEDPGAYGDLFPLEVEIPAYQAALFTEAAVNAAG